MIDSHAFTALYLGVTAIPLGLYVRRLRTKERRAREAASKGELYSEALRGQHPHIDVSHCIGCQGCTSACPEGDVLGMVGGKAAIVKPYRCIGHGLCVEACPVGAITLRTANPSLSADLPYLSPQGETSVPGLYIAGELSGLALIRNAVRQGKDAVDAIANQLVYEAKGDPGVLDVAIVGAGPAGISAALRCIELGLNYLVIERETIGGTVTKYPRQKLVMTSTVEFPLYGPLKGTKLSKEYLLSVWQSIGARDDFRARLNETVEEIRKKADGVFSVKTSHGTLHARTVILALGRGGTPRKLGVKGEELPKVMYRLIEADHYTHKQILVVGGGDSAIEAALGLSLQVGNKVTISYRQEAFFRIKERNLRKLEEQQKKNRIAVVLRSKPVEICADKVVLDVGGSIQEIPNDYVWVFAGGIAPDDFLKKAGVRFGELDLTAAATQAAFEESSAGAAAFARVDS